MHIFGGTLSQKLKLLQLRYLDVSVDLTTGIAVLPITQLRQKLRYATLIWERRYVIAIQIGQIGENWWPARDNNRWYLFTLERPSSHFDWCLKFS